MNNELADKILISNMKLISENSDRVSKIKRDLLSKFIATNFSDKKLIKSSNNEKDEIFDIDNFSLTKTKKNECFLFWKGYNIDSQFHEKSHLHETFAFFEKLYDQKMQLNNIDDFINTYESIYKIKYS